MLHVKLQDVCRCIVLSEGDGVFRLGEGDVRCVRLARDDTIKLTSDAICLQSTHVFPLSLFFQMFRRRVKIV